MSKQIFQTNSPTRWKSFVWAFRLISVLLVFLIASVVISLVNKHNYDLKVLTYSTQKLPEVNRDKAAVKISKDEQIAFAKYMHQLRRKRKNKTINQTENLPNQVKSIYPVRAGFYVNWDINSAFSLKRHISKMNLVIPEWYFLKDEKGKIESRVDEEMLEFIHKNKVAVMPLLSNFYQWNNDSTYLLLKNEVYRKKLIDQIKTVVDTNDFRGINIDFENYQPKMIPYLVKFSKELHEVFHEDGYLTSIDMNPGANAALYKELSPYYDLIFLMAYNEHFPNGEPGCISSLKFVESELDKAMKEIPSEKVVLCVAGYGFDWPKNGVGKNLTYQNIISTAKANDQKVFFNPMGSDISMYYTDDNDVEHEAHCNDAAGIFNLIRTSVNFNAAGVALWYLGSEDPRIWRFYSKNLSTQYLKTHPINFQSLENIDAIDAVTYEGKGEILEIINQPKKGITDFQYDKEDLLINDEQYLSLPSSYMLKRFGANDPKKIALTFDDGPNEEYTQKILDILKEKNIKATFFVTGINIENNIPIIKKMYRNGHEIGNHTFSHPNLELTSENRERIELRSTRLLLESILGYSTLLFRPPYNTDAEPKNLFQIKSLEVARQEGFICVTSFIDPNDWEENTTADSIFERAKAQINKGNVILLHDAGGKRNETIKALPRIIEYYQKQGYQFVLVSDLMNKKRSDVMPVVSDKFWFTERMNMIFFTATYFWDHFLHGFFVVAILLMIFRLLSIGVLALVQRSKSKKFVSEHTDYKPKVSVIVPAFNEELTANRTVQKLLGSDYADLEIIFVDDGSKDHTYQKVNDQFGNHPQVKVLTKPNGGKAAALNYGIERASGEILVCIDADTILLSDSISKMIPYFADEKVGAVAGNVRVGNTVNMLTRWQSIEYTTSQNFDRRAYDAVNAILVVPGAIGAFRKSAMEDVDGFTIDTLAEDCDLTLRLLRAGYRVRTCNEAIANTEAPETAKMFIKQRSRWTFGIMQSFWKHRDLLFVFKKWNISWIALPNLLIFNFIIPIFSPVVDILFIAGLFTYSAPIYAAMYFGYFLLDCIISFMAYKFDRQKFSAKLFVYIFIQRLVYRQIMFYVLLLSYKKAIKGELVSWGILKRTGNVVD